MNYHLFVALTEQVPLFERTLARRPWPGTVLSGDTPSQAWGEMVSGSYFGMLGIAPAAGRPVRTRLSTVRRR